MAADPGQSGSAVGKPEEEEEMDRRGRGPGTTEGDNQKGGGRGRLGGCHEEELGCGGGKPGAWDCSPALPSRGGQCGEKKAP